MSPSLLSRRHAGVVDLLAFHRRWPERYPFLLESVARGTDDANAESRPGMPARNASNSATGRSARYDILFACPGEQLILDAHFSLQGPGVTRTAAGDTASGGEQGASRSTDFLAALDRWWQDERIVPNAEAQTWPFRGGWFVYLAYELVAQIEPGLALPIAAGADATQPVACAVRIPAAVVCDHHRGETWLLAEADHATCLAQLEQDLAALQHGDDAPVRSAATALPALQVEEAPGDVYTQAVARIKRYITEGDVFQVNLSRPWRASPVREEGGSVETDTDPLLSVLYERLRRANPAPFAGLARLPGVSIASSSPERLVRVQGTRVETRPIAGTRPRGSDAADDDALSAELLAHPKERAEHIMLIDLERNDLGRLCQSGTVEVDELMVLERFAHVHHIVSNVCGRLRPDCTPGEVIRAVFPGGTITGCPKVRCMAIIAELEAEPRGAYTGSMGYLNRDGDLDLNILIRTLSVEREQITLRAGAGIVADSDPVRELAETRVKAHGLLLALTTASA